MALAAPRPDADAPNARTGDDNDDLLAELERIVPLVEAQPPGRRVGLLLQRLGDFIGQRAIGSARVLAIDLAYAHRNLLTQIHGLPDEVSPRSEPMLASFTIGWFVASLEQGACVSPPEVAVGDDDDDHALTLTWRREDRSLEVRIAGQNCDYVATWFEGEPRALRIQEGRLTLDAESLGKTLRWLATGEI